MIAEYITIEPFVFKRILTARIEKSVNSHGGGTVVGYIRTEDEAEYTSYPLGNTPVIVNAVGEAGENRILFYGILEDLNITRENSQLLLEVRFTAYTRLMDLLPHRRAFQNGTCTYSDILKYLCSVYDGAGFIMESGFSSVPIQDLVIQYQETDWEFLLRLASHFNAPVISDFLTPGVRFYFGLPGRPSGICINDTEYRLEKSLISYQYKMQNGVTGTSEYDDMTVIWKSQELLEIGDRVQFEDRPYVVHGSVSHLDGHQMIHTYLLSTENGLKMPKKYNDTIIGTSIDGIVTGVQSTVVRVQLGIEDVQPSTRWYPYATVFSSPDGSGWYCMPQTGDEIRLYFPTRSEKHAYAVSSVHKPVTGVQTQDGKTQAPRSNPLNNELKSQDGKVVQLLEDRIVMSNGNGLIIAMIDNEGIVIESTGNLDITAGESVYISGTGLNLIGTEQITMISGGSSVKLSDSNVIISSTDVKVQ
ncbi:MAG: phage baseplate assembly protein V [Clostridium sp.]|nr:phage baseplate assembly protein V [Clostridium sp.]